MQSTNLHTGTLKDLYKLSPHDEEVKKYILALLKNGTLNDQHRKEITSLNLKLLFALAESSPEINTFFEMDSKLNDEWSLWLKELKYPENAIISFDKKVTLSRFTQLKGALLLSEFSLYRDPESPNATALLDKACELGMHDALIMRLNRYSKKITESTNPEHVKTAIKDALKISNLYWAKGCIDAALILFTTVKQLMKLSAQKAAVERFFMPVPVKSGPVKFFWINPDKSKKDAYDSENCPDPIVLLEAAMEYLYLAKLINNLPQSRAINAAYTNSENPLAGRSDGLDDPKVLEQSVLQTLENLKIPDIDIFCKAAAQHAERKFEQYYKDSDASHSSTSSVRI